MTSFPESEIPGKLSGRASDHVHQLGSLTVPELRSLPGDSGTKGRSEVSSRAILAQVLS